MRAYRLSLSKQGVNPFKESVSVSASLILADAASGGEPLMASSPCGYRRLGIGSEMHV